MTLEHCRKDAKALVRAVRAGDPNAIARARDVLRERAVPAVSGAQHVVAVERGYRRWSNLSREGAVFVPTSASRDSTDGLVERVARLSLAVYEEILELE